MMEVKIRERLSPVRVLVDIRMDGEVVLAAQSLRLAFDAEGRWQPEKLEELAFYRLAGMSREPELARLREKFPLRIL